VSTIPFIQGNLQHSTVASRVLSRTVGIKGVEPIDCVPTMNESAWMLPGFSCRDLVSVLIKYNSEAAQRRLAVRSAYLPYDSEDTPPSKKHEELV
jgi:hypothetical protein